MRGGLSRLSGEKDEKERCIDTQVEGDGVRAKERKGRRLAWGVFRNGAYIPNMLVPKRHARWERKYCQNIQSNEKHRWNESRMTFPLVLLLGHMWWCQWSQCLQIHFTVQKSQPAIFQQKKKPTMICHKTSQSHAQKHLSSSIFSFPFSKGSQTWIYSFNQQV